MREIKFRAWHEYKNDYIYFTLKGFKIDIDYRSVPFLKDENDDSYCFSLEEVRQAEWEQYTGLKDKNGIEIYEGDILHGEYKMQCVWNNGDASFKLLCPELGYIYPITSFVDTLEIIGNIHEVKK